MSRKERQGSYRQHLETLMREADDTPSNTDRIVAALEAIEERLGQIQYELHLSHGEDPHR